LVSTLLPQSLRDACLQAQVADVSTCQRIPFYGFHEGERPFLRIRLFNPWLKSRVADLLAEVGRQPLSNVLCTTLAPHMVASIVISLPPPLPRPLPLPQRSEHGRMQRSHQSMARISEMDALHPPMLRARCFHVRRFTGSGAVSHSAAPRRARPLPPPGIFPIWHHAAGTIPHHSTYPTGSLQFV